MGGTIKRCWFNAADPLLPKHVYRADVSPGGGTVKITVHQRAKLGRAATSSPQYLLPKGLSRGIRQLTDQEFDRLLAAVLTEQKRRGKKLSVSHKASRKSPIQEFGPPLTLAKLNAVRAAFKAGVPPSRIARQFGISRADVREALASGTSKRCTASCDNGERSWPHRSPLRRSGQCRSGQ